MLGVTRTRIHANDDPKPPPRGDKPASYNTRKLRSTRPIIRNRLLGVLNLPAMIHAIYDPKPPPRGDKPASYDTRKKIRHFFDILLIHFRKLTEGIPNWALGGGGGPLMLMFAILDRYVVRRD